MVVILIRKLSLFVHFFSLFLTGKERRGNKTIIVPTGKETYWKMIKFAMLLKTTKTTKIRTGNRHRWVFV
jgi:hypothetical protein